MVKSKNFGHSWVQGSFGKIREISMFLNEKSEKIVSFELKVRVKNVLNFVGTRGSRVRTNYKSHVHPSVLNFDFTSTPIYQILRTVLRKVLRTILVKFWIIFGNEFPFPNQCSLLCLKKNDKFFTEKLWGLNLFFFPFLSLLLTIIWISF